MDLNLGMEFYGNSLARWLVALIVALAVMGLVRLITKVLVERLKNISNRTVNEIDDLVSELMARTKAAFVLLVGIWAGSLVLELSPRVDEWIREILILGLLLQGAFWASALVNHFIERYRKRAAALDPESATAMGAVGFLVRIGVWGIFILLALQNLGIDITPLVASLGIGGIAVALALQNVLGDLFASLSIVLDKPFVVGDFIIIGEFLGTVEHVGVKTTRLRALSGEQLVFSNSDLLASRVRNFKRMQERRILFTLGVTYDTGYERLNEIPEVIRDVVESQEQTRFDRAHFKAFGDSPLIFEVVYYMLIPDYNDYMDVQQAINLELYRRFEEQGIDFAFPTRTLHLESGFSSLAATRESAVGS